MKYRRLVAVAIIAALSLPSDARAQESLDAGEIDDSVWPLLSVDVTLPPAVDPSAVEPSLFSISEDGVDSPVAVVALASSQLDVVLAIDTSGSMAGEALGAAKSSALAFIDRLPASARIAVVGVGAEPTIGVPLTDDRLALTEAVTDLVAAGETALYDALVATVEQLDENSEARTVLVVLSDGGDTVSTNSLAVASELTASDFDVVHAISLVTSEQDTAALGQIVSGGGSVAQAVDLPALESVYTDVADRITNQYRLRWESGLVRDGDAKITLEVGGLVYSTTRPVSVVPAPAVTPEVVPPAVTSAPAPPPLVVAPPVAAEGPGTLTDSVLWFGVGLTAVAVFAMGLVLFAPRQRTRSLTQELRSHVPHRRELGAFGRRVVGTVDSLLRRHPERRSGLALRLERAGLDWSPGEAGALAIASSAVLALLGFALVGTLGLVLFPAVGILLGVLLLSSRVTKRRDLFTTQLDGTLQLIAGSLRSGFGINQALGTVAEESEWPTNAEFTRILGEVRLGHDLAGALDDSARRVDSEDYYWVVQAIEISREVGGNLAEVLDNISGTIRQRNTLRRQVKSLSAEGRLSAIILYTLPVLLFVWMRFSNREFSDLLLERTGGQLALLAAGVLMVVGGVWLKKIVEIKF